MMLHVVTTLESDDEVAQSALDRLNFDAMAQLEAQRLFAIAFAILRDSGEAEDATQETFLNAWRRWDTLRDPLLRRPWLTRICVNHCINSRKRLLRRLFTPIPDTASAPPQGPGFDADRDRAMAHLSPDQRAVVALHFAWGYTLEECAALLDVPVGTVRSRLSRGLATLRQEMTSD